MERLPQVMPPRDADMAHRVAESRRGNGVALRLGASVTSIEGGPVTAVVLDSGERIEAGLVILAVGVAESFSVITGAPMWRPLGSTANKMGATAITFGAKAADLFHLDLFHLDLAYAPPSGPR